MSLFLSLFYETGDDYIASLSFAFYMPNMEQFWGKSVVIEGHFDVFITNIFGK